MIDKKRKMVISLLFFALGAIMTLSFLFNAFSVSKYSEMKILMGTFVRIDICAVPADSKDLEDAFSCAFRKIEHVSEKMNVYELNSDVSMLNNSNGKIIQVDKSTYGLISDSLRLNKLTSGAFNIAVWPITKLWKESGMNNELPARGSIEKALIKVNNKNLELFQDNKIRIIGGAQIDLSAIAKGYAVDAASAAIRKYGFSDFFIDAGGDIYASGRNCKGKDWKIGVRDPKDGGRIFDKVALSDSAVTTSGDYEKFYDIKGVKYSHIIDPLSGYPQRGIVSATVIAPSAQEADALSTALCVLTPENGIELIDSLKGKYACLIILEDINGTQKVFQSKEYKKYKLK